MKPISPMIGGRVLVDSELVIAAPMSCSRCKRYAHRCNGVSDSRLSGLAAFLPSKRRELQVTTSPDSSGLNTRFREKGTSSNELQFNGADDQQTYIGLRRAD